MGQHDMHSFITKLCYIAMPFVHTIMNIVHSFMQRKHNDRWSCLALKSNSVNVIDVLGQHTYFCGMKSRMGLPLNISFVYGNMVLPYYWKYDVHKRYLVRYPPWGSRLYYECQNEHKLYIKVYSLLGGGELQSLCVPKRSAHNNESYLETHADWYTKYSLIIRIRFDFAETKMSRWSYGKTQAVLD